MSLDFRHLFSLFREKVADRPMWMFLGGLVSARMAPQVLSRNTRAAFSPRYLSSIAAIASIAVYLAILIWYVSNETYLDFAEPTVTAIAWLFARGQPIYHGVADPERYSHMYGPLAFMIPGWFMKAVGPSILASKTVGGLAALGSLATVHRLIRSTTDRHDGLIAAGLFALLCLIYRHISFWVRPDSFILLFTALGLAASTVRRGWIASVGLGLCAGILVNLKLTGPLYVLPAVGLMAGRLGIGWMSVTVVTGVLTSLVPFVGFSNVSWSNYLAWVGLSANNGLSFSTLRQNLEWGVFILLPLVPTMVVRAPSEPASLARRWGYPGLALGIVGVAIAASKPGGGTYHLMPFWPTVVYALALHAPALRERLRSDIWFSRARTVYLLVVTAIAGVQQFVLIDTTRSMDGIGVVADLARFADANPQRSMAVGYSNDRERWTFARPVLVFRGGPYVLDAPAVQEYQMSALSMPAETIDAIRKCNVEMWLFPKGAEPFKGPNVYPQLELAELFPDSFKQAFRESYERVDATSFFDVWRCRNEARR